jgi:hypothetical protein
VDLPSFLIAAVSGARLPAANAAVNTVLALKRLAPIAGDHRITMLREPQNSKFNHPGYPYVGIEVVDAAGSANGKMGRVSHSGKA